MKEIESDLFNNFMGKDARMYNYLMSGASKKVRWNIQFNTTETKLNKRLIDAFSELMNDDVY